MRQGSLVDDILTYTNQFRHAKNRSDLVIQEELNALALQHSEDMAKGKVAFGHAGFEKREAQVFRTLHGANSVAENVAMGATTAQEVVKMWKNSPGHRENMLGAYKYIGIGVAANSKGVLYYTQIFSN